MDPSWLSIPAGVIAGAASGIGAAWIGRPAASEAAATAKHETIERLKIRRATVDMGRALVAEAYREDWDENQVARDPRFLELRRHLSDEVRTRYKVQTDFNNHTINVNENMQPVNTSHELLQADIELLDQKWKLA